MIKLLLNFFKVTKAEVREKIREKKTERIEKND